VSISYILTGPVRDVEVTRWWCDGSYRWTLHSDTLDQLQIVQLFDLLDPVVGAALLEELRDRKRKEVG
jgi:hypothetical protein